MSAQVEDAYFEREPDPELRPFPEAGYWRLVRGVPLVMCGGSCGGHHRLQGWTVHPNGTVYPSVRCLMPNCGWHAMITLGGWNRSS